MRVAREAVLALEHPLDRGIGAADPKPSDVDPGSAGSPNRAAYRWFRAAYGRGASAERRSKERDTVWRTASQARSGVAATSIACSSMNGSSSERKARAPGRAALRAACGSGRGTGAVGAVEDPVVAGQGQRHQVGDGDLAVADDRPLGHRPDGEDSRLRRVDHGGEVEMPNMPRLETVKVPPESSGGVTVPSRTRWASARVSEAIWRRPLSRRRRRSARPARPARRRRRPR